MGKPNIFLRLKAWQLFIILILPNFLHLSDYFELILGVLFIMIYMGWIYSIGVFMHSLLTFPKPSISYFKLSCLFICCAFIVSLFTGGYIIDQDNYKEYGMSIWFLVPFALYITWSILYIFMFSARMLESVANGYLVYRSDSLKAFFGFWFFPIGVWFIQPVVNRIFNESKFIEN